MDSKISALRHTKMLRFGVCIIILAITYFSIAGFVGTAMLAPAFGWSHGAQAAGEHAVALEGQFARWDSGYYLQIAEAGYRSDGAERAFFPLYPLLTRAISAVSGMSILWSGWLLSTICFLLAGLLLYHWIYTEYDLETGLWSLAWLSFFPVSFFYISFYPEALFLLLSVVSLMYARKGNFIVSGLFISLAGAARPTAFLLAIPYVVEFALQRNFQWLRWLYFAIGALIAPLGIFGYALFLAQLVGDSNPFWVYNSNLELNWRMSTVWPWVTFYYGFTATLFGEGIGSDWFSRAVVWHDLLYALFGLALAVWALPRLRLSMSLFFLASMLFFLSSRGPYGYVFEGMPRHVASIVPVYIALALGMRTSPNVLRWIAIVVSIVSLGVLAAWFASGRWVS